MKAGFFLYLFLGLFAILAGYGVWVVLRAFYSIFADIRTNRELDALAEQLANKRREKRLLEQQRLSNGCQHEFDDSGTALPKDVCVKCGIAREIPNGPCDHRWQIQKGIIPESRCTRCGEHYSGVGTQ